MPDGDVIADDRWRAVTVDVDDRPVLNVGSATQTNHVDVAPDHRREPDAGVVTQLDVADDVRRVGDPYRRRHDGTPAAIGVDHGIPRVSTGGIAGAYSPVVMMICVSPELRSKPS